MKGLIWETFAAIRTSFVGPVMRNVGKRLYETGTKIQGAEGSQDRLVPSLRKLNYANSEPEIEDTKFVAPNATILGNVKAGENTSIWYGSTILGTTPIRIGKNCVIQDRVHISRNVTIGDNVFVGPNSVLQGATLRNRAFVSMGASVRHATVEQNAFVAAGAVILDGEVVKQGQIWAGNPGKFLRNITPLERQILREHHQQMQQLAAIHEQQTEKSFRQVLSSSKQPFQKFNFEQMLQNVNQSRFNYTQLDEQFMERRIFMKQKLQYPDMGKDYEPYDYDTSYLDEKFRVGVHQQELKKVATKIKEKQRFQNDTNPWKQPF